MTRVFRRVADHRVAEHDAGRRPRRRLRRPPRRGLQSVGALAARGARARLARARRHLGAVGRVHDARRVGRPSVRADPLLPPVRHLHVLDARLLAALLARLLHDGAGDLRPAARVRLHSAGAALAAGAVSTPATRGLDGG